MICLVTDRRRLVGPGASSADARRCLLTQARQAVDAGVDLIQVRERDLEAAELASLVADLLAITRPTVTRLIVNDRLDVALACGADGVHLRSDSIAVAAARRLAPAGFLIGRSVHGVDEAAAANGADYLIAGAVFPSESKPPAHARLGIDGLRAVAGAVTAPVLAIGGITIERLEEVAASGVAGVAAIGLFVGSAGASDASGCRASALRETLQRVRARFDSVNTAHEQP
jgi:thiamine-phosphate pyrophosphorylase